MPAPKNKVTQRIISRLEAFYTDDLENIRADYLEALDGCFDSIVQDKQLSLIQEVLANLPIQILPASDFVKLLKVKQKPVMSNNEFNDGKDWARRIYRSWLNGVKPPAISLKWAKEVLEKTGEIEKSIV